MLPVKRASHFGAFASYPLFLALPQSSRNTVIYGFLRAKNAQRLTTTVKRIVAARSRVAAMKTETVAANTQKLGRPLVGTTDEERPVAIRKILAPTDFSPASEKALKYALRFAHNFGSELTLLHVLEPAISPPFSDAEMADAEESLRILVNSVRAAGAAGARSTIRTGVATHEIVEAAKELDVDLIVIATHGYTGWKHFAIGSTAARVARAAPCPVLVVREKEHDFL
jgi:universal stress protein A